LAQLPAKAWCGTRDSSTRCSYLERILRVDGATTNILTAIALALATPAFILFGWLSDRIGRKPIILAGCLIAAVTYTTLFHALTFYANPALAAGQGGRGEHQQTDGGAVRDHGVRTDCRASGRDLPGAHPL
jgi:hypothetical protein